MSGEKPCNPHPDAPHGFARDASHSEGRYVCECEGWEPEAEPSQEPVAWMVVQPDGRVVETSDGFLIGFEKGRAYKSQYDNGCMDVPLYRVPPDAAAQIEELERRLNYWRERAKSQLEHTAKLEARIKELEAAPSQEPVAWMFVPIIKNPRVETAIFTTSKELALSWGYHCDKDLGHGTVTALGVIK